MAQIAALVAFADTSRAGEVPDEKIAEYAECRVEDVAAYRAELLGEAPKAEPEAEPKAEPEKKSSRQRSRAKAEPEASLPTCVRVRRKAVLEGPDRKTLRLNRADVIRGDRAAGLARHYPELVEPFPPAKG